MAKNIAHSSACHACATAQPHEYKSFPVIHFHNGREYIIFLHSVNLHLGRKPTQIWHFTDAMQTLTMHLCNGITAQLYIHPVIHVHHG